MNDTLTGTTRVDNSDNDRRLTELESAVAKLNDRTQLTREAVAQQAEQIERVEQESIVRDEVLSVRIEVLETAPPPPGPVDPPPIDPPPPVDPGDPAVIEAAAIQSKLDQGGIVDVPRNTVIRGSLRIPKNNTRLMSSGTGPRPVVVADPGRHGIDITTNAGSVKIHNVEVLGDTNNKSQAKGVYAFIDNNSEGDLTVETHNCEISYFDTLIHMQDAKNRQANIPIGQPGRIHVTVTDCILHNALGPDTHSVGIYLEGNAEGCRVANTVFAYIDMDNPQKKSHGIYAQLQGAALTVDNCVAWKCAANSFQLRAGGYVYNTVSIETGMGLSLQRNNPKEDSSVINNVNLYCVDIDREDGEFRMDAFNLESPHLVVRRNIAANPLGSANWRDAFASFWSPREFENNAVIGWPAGREYNQPVSDSNLILEKAPDLPTLDESRAFVQKWLARDADTPAYRTEDFIDNCWAAVEFAARNG